MKSTDEKPLEFFEYIVNQLNLSTEVDKQLSFLDGQGVHQISHDTYEYKEQNEFGEYEQNEISVESLLTPTLFREFNKSKNHLYKFSTYNSQEIVSNYLRIQFNIIQKIVNQNHHFLNQHKYFLLPLRGLVNYINQVLILPDMEEFVLDEKQIKGSETNVSDIKIDNSHQSGEELINSIFSYMNGLNEKREQILNHEDFVLLLKYTKELVENEAVPDIERKIEPKISNGLILHSYWVLHKKLYTTHRIKPYFYDFIISVFDNFIESNISSIKSQFGSKSRVKSDKFLPQIILDYL